MFVGVIKTKDIILNPAAIIRMRGLKGYLKLVWRAISRTPYSFIRMTQNSQWFFDKTAEKNQTKKPQRKR